MIALTGTSESLELLLTEGHTTSAMNFACVHATAADGTPQEIEVATTYGDTNGTTAVELAAAPGASNNRDVKYIHINNTDTVTHGIRVRIGTANKYIFKASIVAGGTAFFTAEAGWTVYDANGRAQVGAVTSPSGTGFAHVTSGTMDAAATIDSSTDGTMTANSDALLPTQKAVRTYVAAAVTGLLDWKGDTDCSSNPNYPAASKGDAYIVTVAGKIGGASGKSVEVGDVYIAKADNAGGTEASVGTSWLVLEHNLVGALLTANALSELSGVAATARANISAASTSHASTHGPSGSDALKLDDLEVPDDNTDLNASTSKHGLMPKAVNDTTKFYRSDATQAHPDGRSLFINTADSSAVASTAAETTFDVTYTIVGGTFNTVGYGIRVRASGRVTGISLSTLVLRVKWGSTTLFTTGAVSVGVVTDGVWMFEFTLVVRTNGSSGSVHVTAEQQVVTGRFGNGPGTATTVDLTADGVLGISAQFNGTGANSTKLELLDVQAVNY